MSESSAETAHPEVVMMFDYFSDGNHVLGLCFYKKTKPNKQKNQATHCLFNSLLSEPQGEEDMMIGNRFKKACEEISGQHNL